MRLREQVSSLMAWLRERGLVMPLAIVAAVLMLTVTEGGYQRTRASLEAATEAAQARLALYRLLGLVTRAESAKRGYLLSSRREYLQPYIEAVRDIESEISALQRRMNSSGLHEEPELSAIEQELIERLRMKMDEMHEVLVRFDRQDVRGAMDLMLTDIGLRNMEQIRALADQLIERSNQRIAQRVGRMYDAMLFLRLGILALVIASLLALAQYMRQSRALAAQRAEQQRVVQAERDLLEIEVRRRTADLLDLSWHLQHAREDERSRLARELHDELGALLTAAKLDAARIRPKLADAPPEVHERLKHLTQTLNSGIALKRRIIEDLRPSSLSNLGLLPALEILGHEFAESAGLEVRMMLSPGLVLDAGAQLTAYRMMQEALTNVAKYAHAKSVEVELVADGPMARLTVQDDGIGFDAAQVGGRSSHGLTGMRYRVESEGGLFELDAAPGRGTRLVAWLPRRDPEVAAPASMTPPPLPPAAT
ncbi:CHASE3 domain-containing protein [Sphaerotilus uruguayifluvii]|uniref:histidine kinase n=1 Tax=Sphaerotilus uruguayifluvii TaxID=2735897 RepID=A0ABX2G716_9BURK|nr:CHASE3 domain-containing protein [Leptothrix sp. C29]NRT57820.1 signal transduction histidine kinase [Leptothrix sp. C29]